MAETNEIDKRVRDLIAMQPRVEDEGMIKALDKLIEDFGLETVQQYRLKKGKHDNSLLHEFVQIKALKTLEHAVNKLGFNINVKRESDGNTPAHLAYWYELHDSVELLKALKADFTITNKFGETASDIEKDKEKGLNIIWLDTELTSLDDPHILECAVIITDKHLNELERGHWIVHHESSDLEALSDFHKTTYKSIADGGNGLFDDILRSTTTKEQMEKEMLEMIVRHCKKGYCPLAGSSIHWDREVVRLRLPTVYEYLHYRIVDVSSFGGMMMRWCNSETYIQKQKQIDQIMEQKYTDTTEQKYLHRAVYDIEYSIEYLRIFKPMFETLS